MIFGEKSTLKNISINFGTHKKPFYMVMTTSKCFEKLKFKHFKCPKMNQSRQNMAHGWNGPTNFVLKKNIFYKFHCWFLGENCTLKNISKNFGTHKKPFYMVMTTSKSFEKLKFKHFKCPKMNQSRQNMAHGWNGPTNFVLKKNIFYKFHCWFLGEKCTLKNISINFGTHKKPFYMVMTTSKSFEKLKFKHFQCPKMNQSRQKMAHSWNGPTNFVLKKNIFYKFHCWFLGEKCTLKNISINFGTHKKPFYMVMTTSKSFEKLKFKHFKCPKMNQSCQNMAHGWNGPTNFVLKKNIFYKFHCWFLGEKCTLKNISINFGTHKKPFYMVMTTSKSFENLKFKHFKCPKINQSRPKMAHSWNAPTNFVLKKNIFYKFHCWFLGEKCTLKNISINFGTHKKPFYMVMTTSKSFENLKFKHFKCPKINQSRPKMAHSWNAPTNFVLKKNIFYKFHCWFWGENCTLKNISKNFGTHKKPFYMVITTSKSFEKLKFKHFKCPKMNQLRQNIAHGWTGPTNFVLKNNIFHKFHCWFLGEKFILKNISKNFGTHKNLFIWWWWPRAKVLKNWNLSTSSVQKWTNHIKTWPMVEMVQLTLFWKKTFFINSIVDFWGKIAP